MRRILILAGRISVEAALNEGPTAQKVWEALPIEGTASTWGDEIYFEIPVTTGEEPDARADVTVGELGYWPLGRAFCIFFGPTPASIGQSPRAYSPVNILGRVTGDAARLRAVHSGARVRITRLEENG